MKVVAFDGTALAAVSKRSRPEMRTGSTAPIRRCTSSCTDGRSAEMPPTRITRDTPRCWMKLAVREASCFEVAYSTAAPERPLPDCAASAEATAESAALQPLAITTVPTEAVCAATGGISETTSANVPRTAKAARRTALRATAGRCNAAAD